MNLPTNPFISTTGKKPTCMEMLQLILDGQDSQEQREYFKNHMDNCMPCFKGYHVDMKIKELLKAKCCGGEAPVELVTKIKTQIAENIS